MEIINLKYLPEINTDHEQGMYVINNDKYIVYTFDIPAQCLSICIYNANNLNDSKVIQKFLLKGKNTVIHISFTTLSNDKLLVSTTDVNNNFGYFFIKRVDNIFIKED